MAQRVAGKPQIVLVPWPHEELGQADTGRASNRNKVTKQKQRKLGLVSRLIKRHLSMQVLKNKSVRLASNMAARAVGPAVMDLYGLGRGIGTVISSGPVGVILAAVGLAAAVTVRGLSGRSFEGMGLEIEKQILGDAPEEALAAEEARNVIAASDQALMNTSAIGKLSPELMQVFAMQKSISLTRIRGERTIRRKIDVNDWTDMLALALWNSFADKKQRPSTIRRLTEALRIIVRRATTVGPNTTAFTLGFKFGSTFARHLSKTR